MTQLEHHQDINPLERDTQQINQLHKTIDTLHHQHKKDLLEINAKLAFQANRANQFEEKYKNAIKYKNEEIQLKKIIQELNDQLITKENQLLQLINEEQQKNRVIDNKEEEIDQANRQANQLRFQLSQIKEAALGAILEKDSAINELTEKLEEYQDSEGLNHLRATIADLQEKYRELEESAEINKHELEVIIENKEEEINELQEKMIAFKDKQDERIARLQQDIQDYEKHIEQINQEKYHQENLEEKYYLLEEKLRKSEKKIIDQEFSHSEEKQQLLKSIDKIEQELEVHKTQNEEFKELKNKMKEQEKELKIKKKEAEDLKTSIDKINFDLNKKVNNLESEKKIINQNLELKLHEIDRLKIELEEKLEAKINNKIKDIQKKQPQRLSLAAQISNLDFSPNKLQKKESEESAQIQKLKKKNKQLEENIISLNKRLQLQTKELQETRQKFLISSGSASRSEEETKLLVTIQELNCHIKKIENNLIIHKLKHAEDEDYWKMRENKSKVEIETNMKEFKRQKSQLLERIDRMKKNTVKDKKMDYYQSAFK